MICWIILRFLNYDLLFWSGNFNVSVVPPRIMISSVLAVKNIVQCVIYFALFTILFVETTCTALAFIKNILMLYISWAVAAHAWIKFFVGKWGHRNVTNLFAGVGWDRVHGLFFIYFFVEFYEINEGLNPPFRPFYKSCQRWCWHKSKFSASNRRRGKGRNWILSVIIKIPLFLWHEMRM